jgi:hypothetical protein
MPKRQRAAAEAQERCVRGSPDFRSDDGHAMSLGLAFWAGEEMKRLMLAGGDADIATFQGDDSWLLQIPATFVVGREGKVTAKNANVRNC